ncbi:MAG: integrase core domain-containing protein [Pseudomonas sp.]|uniref:integrase core domain-containing protein n=1 Tax=Acidovorax sp. TaxID=1872122 RepID=UPI0035A12B66|nr:integrase core domain-containing protein [Pseudomonas sp.]
MGRSGWLTSFTCPRKASQNVLAELFDNILKTDLLLQRPANLAQARHTVKQSVGIYYCGRPPKSLKMKCPLRYTGHRWSGSAALDFTGPEWQCYSGRA